MKSIYLDIFGQELVLHKWRETVCLIRVNETIPIEKIKQYEFRKSFIVSQESSPQNMEIGTFS